MVDQILFQQQPLGAIPLGEGYKLVFGKGIVGEVGAKNILADDFFAQLQSYISQNSKYRLIFSQIDTKTITNTITETSQFGTGAPGSTRTILGNTLAVGDQIRVKLYGKISTQQSTTQATIKIYFGGVNIVTSSGNVQSGLVDEGVMFEFIITVRSVGVNGSYIGSGMSIIHSGGVGVQQLYGREFVMAAPQTFNSTQDLIFDTTYQWAVANASNNLRIDFGSIEIIKF